MTVSDAMLLASNVLLDYNTYAAKDLLHDLEMEYLKVA